MLRFLKFEFLQYEMGSSDLNVIAATRMHFYYKLSED
jgi:hypothetical protein